MKKLLVVISVFLVINTLNAKKYERECSKSELKQTKLELFEEYHKDTKKYEAKLKTIKISENKYKVVLIPKE